MARQKAPSRFVSDLAKALKPYGWTWHRTKNHVLFQGPVGQRVTVPCHCGDYRGHLNARAQFRRAGVPI